MPLSSGMIAGRQVRHRIQCQVEVRTAVVYLIHLLMLNTTSDTNNCNCNKTVRKDPIKLFRFNPDQIPADLAAGVFVGIEELSHCLVKSHRERRNLKHALAVQPLVRAHFYMARTVLRFKDLLESFNPSFCLASVC